jgi:hypothetical protein
MGSFINDITINISAGTLGLTEQSFLPLILGSGGSAATGVTVAAELTDLTDAGYLSTDNEYLMASAMFAQSPHVSSVAVFRKADATDYDDALTTLIETYNDFYGIVIDSRDGDDLHDAGTWANANKKYFFGCSEDPDDLTGRNADREAYLIHNNEATDFPECAWVGKMLAKVPGSATFKWKTLSGQNASSFTLTQLTAIRANNGQAIQEQAGVTFVNEGKATSGEYIDIILGKDWVEDQLKIGLLGLFIRNDKIPFDNRGIAQVEGVVRDVLKRAGDNGIIAAAVTEAEKQVSDDKIYLYTVTVPDRSAVSANNRATRTLTDVKFNYTSAGAIHHVTVTGLITI